MSDSYKSDLDIMTSFSILSMLACSTVILPLLSTLELRQGTFARLALFISVSDFFNDLGLAARSLDINNSTTCTFQAFISTFCALASMFWIVLLTHFVFRLVVLNHRNVRIVIMHQCVCWGVPLFLTLIPLVNVTYGVWPGSATAKGTSFLSVQCLFQPLPSSPSWVFHPINNIWAYISLIVWVYLLLVIMIIEILIVLIKSSQLDNIDTRLQIRKFVMYPIALIITQVSQSSHCQFIVATDNISLMHYVFVGYVLFLHRDLGCPVWQCRLSKCAWSSSVFNFLTRLLQHNLLLVCQRRSQIVGESIPVSYSEAAIHLCSPYYKQRFQCQQFYGRR